MPLTWSDLLATPPRPIPFLIDPYVPAEGVVFLYGKTSIGKSPLTWQMALCIGFGIPFFGCRTRQARVLYVEADASAALVQPRIRLLTPTPESCPPGVAWEFVRPFNVLAPHDPTRCRLADVHKDVAADLVIVNTLRKVHLTDDVTSRVPSAVYGALGDTFPGAAILVVHHDKKTPPESLRSNPDEAFSGSQAWLNDAQVGLHLYRAGGGESGTAAHLRLKITKSQVSAHERVAPLALTLHPNGSILTRFDDRQGAIQAAFAELPDTLAPSAKVAQLAARFGLTERSVYRALNVARPTRLGPRPVS